MNSTIELTKKELDNLISIYKQQGLRGYPVEYVVHRQADADSTLNYNPSIFYNPENLRLLEACAKEQNIPFVDADTHDNHAGPVLKKHPVFNPPSNETIIWRYMDLSQLLNLVTSSSLWLGRADVLQKSDPFEGTIPFSHRMREIENILSMDFAPMTNGSGTILKDKKQRAAEQASFHLEQHEASTYNCYINCWHMSDVENFAMWQLYGKSNNSIALRSTFENLEKALGSDKDFSIFAGQIEYIDHNNDNPEIPAPSNFLQKFLYKSHFYRYEQELRLLMIDFGKRGSLFNNDIKYNPFPSTEEIKDIPRGVRIPIDLEKLIDEIVIHPDADPWFKETLEETLENFNTLKDLTISESQVKKPITKLDPILD